MSDKLCDEKLSVEEEKAGLLGPVTLAFLGDAVFGLMVREHLIRSGIAGAAKLHRKAVSLVNAGAQAKAVDRVLPMLTPREREILRRGRNANTSHVPKNADLLDYRHATGLEALFGYLYLAGEKERLREIFLAALGA